MLAHRTEEKLDLTRHLTSSSIRDNVATLLSKKSREILKRSLSVNKAWTRNARSHN